MALAGRLCIAWVLRPSVDAHASLLVQWCQGNAWRANLTWKGKRKPPPFQFYGRGTSTQGRERAKAGKRMPLPAPFNVREASTQGRGYDKVGKRKPPPTFL